MSNLLRRVASLRAGRSSTLAHGAPGAIVVSPSTLPSLNAGDAGYVTAVTYDTNGIATGAPVYFASSNTDELKVDPFTGFYIVYKTGTLATIGGFSSLQTTTTLLAANPDTLGYGNLSPGNFQRGDLISIVNDPTGDGRGKTYQLSYPLLDLPAGTHTGPNVAMVGYIPPVCGFGGKLFVRNDFWFPGNLSIADWIARKLHYLFSHAPDAGGSTPELLVITGWVGPNFSEQVYAQNTGITWQRYLQPPEFQPHTPLVPLGRWVNIETRVTMPSSKSASDGGYELMVDGYSIVKITGVPLNDVTEALAHFANYYIDEIHIGDQLDVQPPTDQSATTEVRLADNVTVTSTPYLSADQTVAQVEIPVAAPSIATLTPLALNPKVYNTARELLTNYPVALSSSNTAVATTTMVNGRPCVVGVTQGTATITATAGGHTASVVVTVTSNPIYLVEFEPCSVANFVNHGTAIPAVFAAYPGSGVPYGWEHTELISGGDDDSTAPHQFASHQGVGNANGPTNFVAELNLKVAGVSFAPGLYDVRVSLGAVTGATIPYAQILDSDETTVLATINAGGAGVAADHYMDAGETVRARATWLSSNTAARVRVTGSKAFLRLGNPAFAGASYFTYLSFQKVGA